MGDNSAATQRRAYLQRQQHLCLQRWHYGLLPGHTIYPLHDQQGWCERHPLLSDPVQHASLIKNALLQLTLMALTTLFDFLRYLGQMRPCATASLGKASPLPSGSAGVHADCIKGVPWNLVMSCSQQQVPLRLQVRAQRCRQVLEPPRLPAGCQARWARHAGALVVAHRQSHHPALHGAWCLCLCLQTPDLKGPSCPLSCACSS